MSEKTLETAAIEILRRGVELDQKKRYTEALVCYQEGLQLLINALKDITNADKKQYFRSNIENYISRAEKLKKQIEEEKTAGKYHEQILIENDSTGHSYKSLFGRFLDEDVIAVEVEDPYIRNFHQCQNFLRLCELLVKSCNNLSRISLVTALNGKVTEQSQWIESIKHNLELRYKVHMKVSYSPTLHDRQIKLSSGWIIKIGRGLDYFKAPESKLSLGVFDLDLRPCYETVVDIFHVKDVKMSYG